MRSLLFLTLVPFVCAAAPNPARDLGEVTQLRLERGEGRAELTIQVSGDQVRWSSLNHFPMLAPPRVVIDIPGTRSRLPAERYAGIDRGGIIAVRTSQYLPDVVRVVVDLSGATNYAVTRVPEGIRVTLSADAADFQPWSSGATGRAAREPSRPAQQIPTQTVRQQTAPPISVSFFEADIRDVLATFAEFSRRSIVAGSGVSGISVTAEITRQPWDVALETILRAYGLAHEELPSGIIRVERIAEIASRRELEPIQTRTFRLNYVQATELANSIAPLRSPRGSIVANASTNMVIVTDVGSVIQAVETLVPQLDVRTPQVAIQAKIIFVNRTDAEELGVTYDLKDSRGNALGLLGTNPDPETPGGLSSRDIVSLGGSSIAALGNASARVTGPSLSTLTSLVLGRYTLLTFIDALQTAELSDVQAAPLVTTLDNQEANIWVGERTPIRVVDAGGIGGGGAGGGGGTVGAVRATAQLVETGIRLQVTPTITADRRVLMRLHAERSNAQLAATDVGVTFQTQQGDTRVMVRDGETAVIGGLTVSETAITRAGIPFLMDIPVVGALFRTTRRREQKRDLLIMVTPHIVQE